MTPLIRTVLHRPRRRRPTQDRFWAHVEPEPNTGCWLWVGSLDGGGYGRFWDGRRQSCAHRVAFEIFRSPIPPAMEIDHLCRVRPCVNPQHLETVTPSVNQRRGGPASRTACLYDHPYTSDNIYVCPRGRRRCRACRRRHGGKPLL